jgi:tetratricopeptide (TPR) repeat protein
MLPNYVPLRANLALLKNLKGDFQGAEDDVKAIPNPDAHALQMLAYSQTGRGLLGDAAATYEKIRVMGGPRGGPSPAASGLGDLAIYEGRFTEAVRILKDAAAADRTAGNSDKAAIKLTGVAYAQLLAGDTRAAIASAEEALASGKSLGVRFLSARVLAEAGAFDKARPVADALAAELPAEPQAHGKILQGLIALKSGNPRQAISDLTAANSLIDTWFGHFDLGRAYLAYGALPQADSQLDLCISRRGEALTLMDEGPTYGYFPLTYYYRGRVREALKTASFADSYREYLKIRGTSTEDPLVRELRKSLH